MSGPWTLYSVIYVRDSDTYHPDWKDFVCGWTTEKRIAYLCQSTFNWQVTPQEFNTREELVQQKKHVFGPELDNDSLVMPTAGDVEPRVMGYKVNDVGRMWMMFQPESPGKTILDDMEGLTDRTTVTVQLFFAIARKMKANIYNIAEFPEEHREIISSGLDALKDDIRRKGYNFNIDKFLAVEVPEEAAADSGEASTQSET